MLQWWMRVLSLLITITRGNVPFELDDVLDAIAGETCLVKTWAENDQFKFLTVFRGNSIRLTAFFIKTNLTISKDQKGVIQLKYSNATRELSLILENFSREDEAKYNVEEMVADTGPNPLKRKGGKWNFVLNVIDPSEIMKGNVGGSSLMKFRKSPISGYLYYYDQIVANLSESDCRVLTHSHLHGRLRCSIDNNRHWIIIENVTQRDTGLYKVANNKNNDSERTYLNVTDQTTIATNGENVTIDWFYSQQGINRTLRVIHSNNGIMMMLSPNIQPQIVPAFQGRLLYSGEKSRCYMSLTLLNIGQNDSGVYKIETLHGTTLSGCKHLLVEGITTARILSTIEQYTYLTDASSTYTSVNIPYSQPTSVSTDSGYTANLNTSSTDMPHYTPTVPAYVQQSTIISGVPIYVVILMAVVILALTGCVLWIHRKKNSTLKTDPPHSLKECDTELYITPIGEERHLPIPLMYDGHAADSKSAKFDSRMLFTHTNQNMCMDGYEMVDVSSNDVSESVFNNDETVYEPTETISKTVQDNCGYLSVLGVLETSV